MEKYKGYLFSIVAAVGFGAQPLFASFVYGYGVGSTYLALLRVACMVPVFAALMLWKKESFAINLSQFARIAVLALTGAVLTTSLLFASYNLLDTGIATALNFTYPVFTMLLTLVAAKERPSRGMVVSLVLCVLGVCLFCKPSGGFSWQGFFMALGSGMAYGFYVFYLDKSGVMGEVGFNAYTFWFFLLSSLMLLPMTAVSGQLTVNIPLPGWGFVLLFAIDGGIVATVLLQRGIAIIGGTRASILGALEPVASVVLGAAFMDEGMTLLSIFGIAAIVASSVILVLSSKKETA